MQMALSPDVVKRALKMAVLVGPVLIAINQGDAVLAGQITAVHYLKMVLTVLVPYGVSTLSSVAAMRRIPE